MKIPRVLLISGVLACGLGVGIYYLGKNHAAQATAFLDSLETAILDPNVA